MTMRCYNCDRESPNEQEHVGHRCLNEDVERVRRIINRVGLQSPRTIVPAPSQEAAYDAMMDAHSRLGMELNQVMHVMEIHLTGWDRVRAFFGRTVWLRLHVALDVWDVKVVATKSSVWAEPLRRKVHHVQERVVPDPKRDPQTWINPQSPPGP